MIILTLRTDNPDAEIGLYDSRQQVDYEVWTAHRQLAETIHIKIDQLLERNHKTMANIEGIVVFQGPGSFTGLRIGISTANALAYGLEVPLVAAQDGWIETGISRILDGESDGSVVPEYGAPVHITQQKK